MSPRSKTKFARILDDQEERVLERIGFRAGSWEQMRWYVNLTAKELTKLTKGEFQTLEEEFMAVRTFLFPNRKPRRPTTKEEMDALRSKIYDYLLYLLNEGDVEIGKFEITHEIHLSESLSQESNKPSLKKMLSLGPLPLTGNLEVTHQTRLSLSDDKGNQWLLDHFARLLGSFGNAIRRCPHCNNLFLQLRKSAKFCRRECQNQAAMKQIRERRRQERPKKVHKAKSRKRTSKPRR